VLLLFDLVPLYLACCAHLLFKYDDLVLRAGLVAQCLETSVLYVCACLCACVCVHVCVCVCVHVFARRTEISKLDAPFMHHHL
jgi:hypothetical protein